LRRLFTFWLLWAAFSFPALAQTTQGLILGRIVDSVTGLPLAASVVCTNEATGQAAPASSQADGQYSVASLSPGRYRVNVEAPGYQAQQARALELPVAARVELNFRLRPLYDVWEAGQFRSLVLPGSQQALGFYGPDVDTSRSVVFNANRGLITPLENSRSDVISTIDIENLPLLGRDVYTMLLLLPGVTSDAATARGLGFSVNGQRPSSSNYLLDGTENNNLLVTGPLSAAVPEFVQEYRVSTTNFSAEYGRTSGFLANAITRSGGNEWHAKGYFYFESDRLNANGFQENASSIARPPFTQIQPGVFASGPLIAKKLFVSGGFQTVRAHGRSDPQIYALPTTGFINSTDQSSYGGNLLRTFRPETSPTGAGPIGLVSIAPVTGFERLDGLARLDYVVTASTQVFARLAIDRINQPDLLFNPYRAFSSQFNQRSIAVAAGVISRLRPTLENEFRLARTGDSVRLETPHSELPTIADDESFPLVNPQYSVILPGNAGANDYGNRGRNWEFLDNLSWIRGRHALKFGGGLLQRSVDLSISVFPRGLIEFNNLADFVANQPSFLTIEFDRLSASHDPVTPQRSYRYRQAYAFVQDSFHVNNRLTLDYGVRYEFFGSPMNTGAQKDLEVQLASAKTIQASLTGSTLVLPSSGGDQAVYNSKASNWAARAAFGFDLTGKGTTLLRGSYGIFYDRPFDNLWENIQQNRYQTGFFRIAHPVPAYSSLKQLEALGQFQPSGELIPFLAFQPGLRAPRTNSAFLGIQQKISRDIQLEVDGLASRSTQLITTDEVNRTDSVAPFQTNNLFGLFNPALDGYVNYRANQGSARYAALATAIRFRKTRFHGQISYTWSHSIDNQSEPLAGTFFDFNTFAATRVGPSTFTSSFTRQFASSLDRGNSDFDQRHNLVFFVTYQPPPVFHGPVFRNWTFSTLGAARSGLPFSVYAIANYTAAIPEIFVNQRADLVDPAHVYVSQPTAGGQVLLNPAAFRNPGQNVIGSSGRNAFRGPGVVNVDASVARTFSLHERLRLNARVDFYNFLNHANLNNPASFLGSPQFGTALYGRSELNNGFPLSAPLSETSRQVQILLRIEF
jgi:hypothetical protein